MSNIKKGQIYFSGIIIRS